MTSLSRPWSLVVLALFLWALVSHADASAFTYLQSISDQFQQTIDVYTVADAAGNHFAARGEFDTLSLGILPAMDEISTNGPCLGITCLTATYNPAQVAWGGWYFMNGILGPTGREPTPNWGTVPMAGYDASGATALTFMARGAAGGEAVTFFCCGVGFNPNTGLAIEPYPDSAQKVATSLIHLTTSWAQYTIPLTGVDLHYTLGGFGWVALGTDQPGQRPITFYLDNIQFVKPRPNDPRLLVSYQTIKSTNEFDVVERNAAFVYDNSIALIALLGQGDLARAQTIADALVYGQDNDRYFSDGRVRNAYQGGDIALPPGWIPNNRIATARMPGWYDPTHSTWYEDETQVSSNTGNIAWTALALLDMWEETGNSKYLAAAQTLGSWVIGNTSEQRGGTAGALGGFTGGYDGWENGAVSASAAGCVSGILVDGQCKRLYKSTEHNIDLYSVFMRLFKADGSPRWANAAQQAKHFFLSNFDATQGKFWTGTAEDGATISTDVIPIDIQAWSIQARGSEAGPYLRALSYVESNHKTSLGYGFKQDGMNSCGDYTWFEGTSQVALSYLLAGNQSKWQSIIANVHSVQDSSGGVPATDGPCLNTGFTLDDGSPWEYFPRIHVGASGWLSLAENAINPYKPSLYSPQLSSQSISFAAQTIGTKSSIQTVTLSNPGALPLSIQGVSVSGTNPQDFTQTNTCGNTLPAGANCSVSVIFDPAATGTRSAILTIAEISDPAMAAVSFSVALTGSGAAAQLSQTITFLAPSNQSLSTTTLMLVASASSGLPVMLTSNTPSICTVVGGVVTLLATGTCSITASQAGNTSYAAATPVTQSFTVSSAAGTVAPSVSFILYPVPTPSSSPYAIANGPDGALWFTEASGNKIGRITTAGVITEYALPTANAYPEGITAGQDGAVWFVEYMTSKIGRITTSGAITEYVIPASVGSAFQPANIATGSDGALWFTGLSNNIGRITTSGAFTKYTAHTSNGGLGGITAGPDQALWFVDYTTGSIGRITTSGSITEYPGAGGGGLITIGPDGALWFTEPYSGIGRITTAGVITLYGGPGGDAGITTGPDGALWVMQFSGTEGVLGRITPTEAISGEITYYNISEPNYPPVNAFGASITTGPDGALWFTDYYPNLIGRATLVAPSPNVTSVANGASFTQSFAPGMLMSVFGTGLSTGNPQTLTTAPLPLTSLSGTSIAINGIPAPLLYISATQINCQIPYEVAVGNAVLTVTSGGQVSSIGFSIQAAFPGIFVDSNNGNIVPNESAAAGSTIGLFVTGAGLVTPSEATGNVPATGLTPIPNLPVTMTVGGVAATLEYKGLPSWSVGVLQLNFVVPSTVPAGSQPVVVTVGGVASKAVLLTVTK